MRWLKSGLLQGCGKSDSDDSGDSDDNQDSDDGAAADTARGRGAVGLLFAKVFMLSGAEQVDHHIAVGVCERISAAVAILGKPSPD